MRTSQRYADRLNDDIEKFASIHVVSNADASLDNADIEILSRTSPDTW